MPGNPFTLLRLRHGFAHQRSSRYTLMVDDNDGHAHSDKGGNHGAEPT